MNENELNGQPLGIQLQKQPEITPAVPPEQYSPQYEPQYVQQNTPQNTQYTPKPYAPKPPCIFTEYDRCYALIAVLVGFFTIKTWLESSTGLGLMATVTSIAATLFNFLYCRRLGMRGGKTTNVLFVSSLVLSLSFFVCDGDIVLMFCVAVILLSNTYFSYASFREGSRSVLNNLFRATLMSPFYEFGSLFSAVFKKREKESNGKADLRKALPVIAGAVLSIPLCVVVIALLGSADKAFESIFAISPDKLAEWITENLLANIFILALSLPVGMYIFAAPYSRAYKMRYDDTLEKTPPMKTRILPPSMCAAFLTPLSVIYVMFTALQLYHVFTASVLSSPDFTYAEYAREGFFQLCAVAVIDLSVIAAIMYFSKRDHGKLSKLLRTFVIVFSLLTECLIVTALSKMLLYISIYGMTTKRVQTSVFMLYLFVMFIILIVKQFKSKLSFTKIGYCLAVIALALLAFVPVDALIARYNIAQYNNGNIPWMGRYAMTDLDASAAAVFAQLPDDQPDKLYFFKTEGAHGESYEHMTAWDFNIQRYIAGKNIAENAPDNLDLNPDPTIDEYSMTLG